MRSVVRRVGIVAAIAGLASALAPGTGAAAPACPASLAPADEASLAAMINQTRRAQGVAKVKRDDVLFAVGRRKSMAMARGARFAHSASGASLPWAKGRAAGQNIAMAPTAEAAFQAMLDSPSHRENLLARAWRFAGVGAARDCSGTLFVTINLMAPAPKATG